MTTCHVGNTTQKLQKAREVIRAQEALLEWYKQGRRDYEVKRDLERQVAKARRLG